MSFAAEHILLQSETKVCVWVYIYKGTGHLIMAMGTAQASGFEVCRYGCVVLHRAAAAPAVSAAELCCFFLSPSLLQFWTSSHCCCCIDTPVEGPGEESCEPAARPHYPSFRAPRPSNLSPSIAWHHTNTSPASL